MKYILNIEFRNLSIAGADPSWPLPLLTLHHPLHPCCLGHIFNVTLPCLFVCLLSTIHQNQFTSKLKVLIPNDLESFKNDFNPVLFELRNHRIL